uniref:Uncharacterized protein n=1 Tax=Picea sitchensis TaxID=3332 RepID=D5AB39_PICSI|nr:unknown [Picea sitchensis]
MGQVLLQFFVGNSFQSVNMGFEKFKLRARTGLKSLAGASVSLYNSIAHCLHSRKYERLTDKRRKRVRKWKLGGQKRRSRAWRLRAGAWRLRAVPKLRFKRASPKTMLAKLRDSYVKMMLSLSSSAFFSRRMMGNNLGTQCTSIVLPFGRIRNAQFDENIDREMYRSEVAQGQQTHRSITL